MTSTAVPKVVFVLMNASSRSACLIRSGSVSYTSRDVKAARVFAAGSTIGAAITGAVWIASYRKPRIAIDVTYGDRYFPCKLFWSRPWWTPFAGGALLLVGAALSLWLLPAGRTIMGRIVSHFANPS